MHERSPRVRREGDRAVAGVPDDVVTDRRGRFHRIARSARYTYVSAPEEDEWIRGRSGCPRRNSRDRRHEPFDRSPVRIGPDRRDSAKVSGKPHSLWANTPLLSALFVFEEGPRRLDLSVPTAVRLVDQQRRSRDQARTTRRTNKQCVRGGTEQAQRGRRARFRNLMTAPGQR